MLVLLSVGVILGILSFVYLVIKLLLVLMNEFWIRVVRIICVHIGNGSSILNKLMLELFIWVVVMLAISLGWGRSG